VAQLGGGGEGGAEWRSSPRQHSQRGNKTGKKVNIFNEKFDILRSTIFNYRAKYTAN
jgi:hypothetical protein